MTESTTIEWCLEVEWDRKSNNGSYSRHSSREKAREELFPIMAEDPPARWRIYRRTVTIDNLDQSKGWSGEP